MNIKEKLSNHKNNYSVLVDEDTTLEELFEIYQYLEEQNDEKALSSFLENIANKCYYYDLKDKESYISLAIKLISYVDNPEWLASLGYNLLNAFNKNEEYQKIAYNCFLLGSKMKPDTSRESYFGDFDRRNSIFHCQVELGKCLLNGIGVKKDVLKAAEELHEAIGTQFLSIKEFYDIVVSLYEEIKSNYSLKDQYYFAKLCLYFDHNEDEPFVDELYNFGTQIAKEIYKNATLSKTDCSKENWFKELQEEISL